METGFCLAALDAVFRFGQPGIWNSDQGSRFTAADFLAPLQERGILISMDACGRALDNVFIKRLWRSLRYELIDPRRIRLRLRTVPGAGELLPRPNPAASAPSARRVRKAAISALAICEDVCRCPANHETDTFSEELIRLPLR
jgi:transposase InsO family protein